MKTNIESLLTDPKKVAGFILNHCIDIDAVNRGYWHDSSNFIKEIHRVGLNDYQICSDGVIYTKRGNSYMDREAEEVFFALGYLKSDLIN